MVQENHENQNEPTYTKLFYQSELYPLWNLKHKDSFGKSENLSKKKIRRNSSIWSWLWRQVIEQ